MREKGMGRTRLGRFAALTVPATIATAGLGFAIVQGMVAANLSAADPFTVAGTEARGTGLELSLRGAETATANNNDDVTTKKSALVTLKQGTIDGLCLAVNQPVPILGNIGLNITAPGTTSLGDVDLSADSIAAGATTLPQTSIGVAQSALPSQSGIANGYQEGGFGLLASGNVTLANLDADVYALTLESLEFGSGLTIAPQLATASC